MFPFKFTKLQSYCIISDGTVHNVVIMCKILVFVPISPYKLRPLFTIMRKQLDFQISIDKLLLVKLICINNRFSYKPFWCCFLLLNSELIFQIFTFVHTGFTRCLHDFFTLEKLCKFTKNF